VNLKCSLTPIVIIAIGVGEDLCAKTLSGITTAKKQKFDGHLMDIQKMLSGALTAHDNQKDRSLQVEIGPSQIGDCRRRVYHQIIGTPKLNQTESLAAILGTFIHAGVAEAIKREDPFKDNFLIEQEFEFDGLKGHCDLYIKDERHVVDWKTTKVKSLRFFPSEQQKMQVQLYGWLLSNNGYEVDKVSLVAIARDGAFSDIKVHTEAFDPEIAQRGLQWLAEVKQNAIELLPPAPEKYVQFCAPYCSYYDPTGATGCPSIQR